jgi:predicted deacylase
MARGGNMQYVGVGMSVGALVVLLLGAGWLFFGMQHAEEQVPVSALNGQEEGQSIPTPAVSPVQIGASVEGRAITLYRFGTGEQKLLFVGGIHGGYEWNSVALAYEAIDYFSACTACVSKGVSVLIIPALNPDGLAAVIGGADRAALRAAPTDREVTVPGRLNARGVDLNRNFACKWQPTGVWRGTEVSAGSEAFSEPEARVLREIVLQEQPTAVVFWHSKAGAVYASECHEGVLPETLAITRAYAASAGYRAVEQFDAYPVTGDAEGWLASIGIPAITVELETHNDVEWERNKAGMQALFTYYEQ